MNKDWKREDEGYLELWDMDKKVQIENIEPRFNR
jgi:Rps23 Pro-64 3,4-dihydroxylase Tpa1-like proline 4-hydroxylase